MRVFSNCTFFDNSIGPSLSKYLRRDSDDLSWIATELLMRRDSPFYNIVSIIGKRVKGRHITLQNLYRTLHFFLKDVELAALTKEEKLNITLLFNGAVKENLATEWHDYSGQRLTHIVCLDALSLAAGKIMNKILSGNRKEELIEIMII